MTKMAYLGLFVFASFLILFAGVFVIGNQQRLFTRTFHLRTEFTTVSGLMSGAEVRLGGLRKGTIDDIQLPSRPGDKVVVSMSMDSTTRGLLKQDSRAAIETEGLLGNKYLALSFGSPTAPGVKDWDTLASAPPLDASDLLKKANEIIDATHSTMTNLNRTTGHVAAITARIHRGEGTVGALLNERGIHDQLTAIMTDLAATTGEARITVGQAKVGVTAFQENMQALKQNILFRGFFKDRGYLDASELTKWELASLPAGAPLRTFGFATRDLFDAPDGFKLKAKRRLSEVGTYLEQTPFSLVVIRVTTGSTGTQEANLVLTQAQAMALRNHLAERFELDDAKLRTHGMGEVPAAVPGKGQGVEITVYQ